MAPCAGITPSYTLKTAGEPKQLALKNERKSITNNEDGLIFLTLEIQVKKGIRHPFADNEIIVEVSGAGELIGLDSGNQFSHELYKQNVRKAYDGRLLLTIRPTGKGKINVVCKTVGILSANISVTN